MDRADLLNYARHHFGVQTSYEWAGFRDDCVLKSPTNGRWFAYFGEKERTAIGLTGSGKVSFVDIRYTKEEHSLMDQPGFTVPVQMTGNEWLGVILDLDPDESTVHRLLSRAFTDSLKERRPASEHLIHVPAVHQETVYHDAAIPKPTRPIPFAKPDDQTDRRIFKMQRMYDYTLSPLRGRAKNFYRQGQFMADYEPNGDTYHGSINRFYATYHDLNAIQLDAYFSWRTQVRHHKMQMAPMAFFTIYIYELLNLIGVSSPQDGYQQLKWFSQAANDYLSDLIAKHLRQWQRDFAIYYQLDAKIIQEEFRDEIVDDKSLDVLLQSDQYDDHDVTAALRHFGSYHLDHCPLYKQDQPKLEKSVATTWQLLMKSTDFDAIKNFIGWHASAVFRPFGDAVFYPHRKTDDRDYHVDAQRRFTCRNGRWTYEYYLAVTKRSKRVGNLLHEIDRLLRQYYHVGRKLTPKPVDDQLIIIIKHAIVSADRELQEARRPKIKIDLSDLDQIRADASVTRESLLTDEERQLEAADEQAPEESPARDSSQSTHEEVANNTPATSAARPVEPADDELSVNSDLGLTADEGYLLTHLLNGEDWHAYAKQHHWLVLVLADGINDKLFDEIGDTVIEFDDQDQPQLVEDYIEDVKELLSEED